MGEELPTGTVTLLFSDIESSTRMVHALGDDWARVLEQQRRLGRRAWERHGGVEMGTEGDSFFVVFASPRDAVAAGLRLQASVAAATWPEGSVVRVRIGVHTGTPTRHADGYVGMDVHRAARVAAAAHGGQLLVTDATMRLVADWLPVTVVARDLGEHQLKDIPSRTRVHQLSPPGQDAGFPPLRTLGGAGSLPTSLRDGVRDVVGRDEEVARLVRDVGQGARLLTLTGPGGVGKSTLAGAAAAQVAAAFTDGVFVVPLVGVTSAAGMWAAMSQVLDVPPDGQVPPTFFDHLGDRRLLVVLDNLEQIPDADHVVRELLTHAPHVTVVATSRRALHVSGEHEHPVGGLAPDDAVAMFGRQAARARPGFAVDERNRRAVEALCAALDRLPLALEIAAARVKVLSPQAMLARIDSSLDLATGDRGRDERQATLRGAIAWSYDLLDATRRTVLDHLGVFVGGAPLEAVEAVVGADALGGEDLLDVLFDLVDSSMVVAGDTPDGEPRFHLLETVRRFALDGLTAAGRLAEAERRHARHHLLLLPGLRRELTTGDYRTARETFLLELANLDAMVARSGAGVTWDDEPVPPAHVSALVAEVGLASRLAEDARQWCEVALRDQSPDPLGRAWLTTLQARAATFTDSARALEVAGSALEQLDRLDPATSRPWVSAARIGVEAAHTAALMAGDRGDLDTGEGFLARLRDFSARADDPMARSRTSELGSMFAMLRGDLTRAWELQLETAEHRRAAGIALDVNTQNNLAHFENQGGRRDLAQARLAEHLPAVLAQGDPLMMAFWAETMAASVAEAHPALCVRAEAMVSVFRVVEGIGNDEAGDAETAEVLALARSGLTAEQYDAAWARGLDESLTDLLDEMARSAVPPPGADA